MFLHRETDLVSGNIQGGSGFKILCGFHRTFAGQPCRDVSSITSADDQQFLPALIGTGQQFGISGFYRIFRIPVGSVLAVIFPNAEIIKIIIRS